MPRIKRPNIIRGGSAIPLGSNYYLMKGRKHEQGGIDIGKNLEVEDNEVVHVGNKELKVYSAQRFLGGKSPAELVIEGNNPAKVFKAQEDFKDRNKINDDGSKRKHMGGLSRNKDYGSKKKPYPKVASNDFAGKNRSYPIPTKADAVDALRLAGLHGRSDVKAKVYKKYPELKKKANGGRVYLVNIGGREMARMLPSTGERLIAKSARMTKTAPMGADHPLRDNDYIIGNTYNRRPGFWELYLRNNPEELVNMRNRGLMVSIYNLSSRTNNNKLTRLSNNLEDYIPENLLSSNNRTQKVNINYPIIEENVEIPQDTTVTPNNNVRIRRYSQTPYRTNLDKIKSIIYTNSDVYGFRLNPNEVSRIEDTDFYVSPNSIKRAINYSRYNQTPYRTNLDKIDYGYTDSELNNSDNNLDLPYVPLIRNRFNNGTVKPTSTTVTTTTPTINNNVRRRNITIPDIQSSISFNRLPNTSTPTTPSELNYVPSGNPVRPRTGIGSRILGAINGSNIEGIGDLIGLGSNILSSFIGRNRTNNMLNSLEYNPRPIARQAAKLRTRININPQLDRMRETLAQYERDVTANTASSRTALARRQRGRSLTSQQMNELEANRENIETQLINQDRINRQRVASENIEDYNRWAAGRSAFRNSVAQAKEENDINLINNINAGIQDTISRGEQRRRDRRNLHAISLASPNLPAEMLYASGVWNKNMLDTYRKAYPRKR